MFGDGRAVNGEATAVRRRERILAGFIALALCLQAGAATVQDEAGALLAASGVQGGLVVQLGCGDGRLAAALRVNERYLVHALDTDPARVAAARETLLAAGGYGAVSVDRYDGTHLPYVDNLVNLIVSPQPVGVPRAEILRVLAPLGVALLGGEKIVKPWPADIDGWPQYLHGPDNNAVAADRVCAEPRSIQWVASPRWGRSHEELASMSAAVSAKGRLFFIADEAPLASIRFEGQWTLAARDAFNGTLLWKQAIPDWSDTLRHFRSGPVHLPRRLATDGERVFVTLGLSAPVSALDAATGRLLRVYEGTGRTEEIVLDGGILYLVVGTSEVRREGGGLFDRGEPPPSGFRFIAAVEADTGRMLWRHDGDGADFVMPLSLAVKDGGVFFLGTDSAVRLDARTGREVWRTPRTTLTRRMSFSAPTVVAAGGVLLCADRVASAASPATHGIDWGINGWNEAGFDRSGKSVLRAYAADTGRELWSADCSEGYNSPVDLFVVGDTAWVGSNFKGYDLRTGELKQALEWKGAPVAMAHHRCYRNKATERNIYTGRSGIEVVSLDRGWLGNNSWIRGTCQYGILPCNGLLYAPPNACACFSRVKLEGFFAAAPQRGPVARMTFDEAPALEKGPAYAEMAEADSVAPDPADWPAYRRDAARSGAATASVSPSPSPRWTAAIGGRLTQPVIAGGRVCVASIDAHTVYALNAADGKAQWHFTAGGRIDSAPALYRGRVLFGAADGWVYCLRASDGRLAWRFRAAPRDRRAAAYDQLESAWPVHGAVLVQNDAVYATAGRSTYLDGGLAFYRIDPATGKALSHQVVSLLDPETGRQTGKEGARGFDMEGTTTDLLSGDGESVFLKHCRFDLELNQVTEAKPHLFSIMGFLGEEWFVRSYWLIGDEVGAGWGGWARAAAKVPFGRILCFNETDAFGYGRVTISGGPTGHRADAYHLFRMPRPSETPAVAAPDSTEGRRKARTKTAASPSARSSKPEATWSDKASLIVRAMVLTPDQIVVAGPPDVARKDPQVLAFENPDEALAGFRGEKGVRLRVVSVSDGKTVSECDLPSMPVFDGMSAAGGRLYLSTRDGRVLCYGDR